MTAASLPPIVVQAVPLPPSCADLASLDTSEKSQARSSSLSAKLPPKMVSPSAAYALTPKQFTYKLEPQTAFPSVNPARKPCAIRATQ